MNSETPFCKKYEIYAKKYRNMYNNNLVKIEMIKQ